MPSPKKPAPGRFARALAAVRANPFTHTLAAIVGLVLAAGVTVVIDQPGPTPGPGQPTVPHKTITVTLGGPGKSRVALPPAAQAVAQGQALDQAAGSPGAAESNLHGEPPAASAPATVGHDKAIAPANQPVSPAHIPQAAVNVPGCRTLHVRNYSSRTGSPTLLFVEHQTISPDNGWNGVLGVVRWFDSSAALASSNFVISRAGGQCAYIVPMAYKAWAQAGFNRVAVSVEVTETGNEPSYLVGAGRARMIQLERLAHHVYGIPYRHGAVNTSTCTVIRSGYVEHKDLGQCGGGHFDDGRFSIDPLIAAAAAADHPKPKPVRKHKHVTAADRRECKHLRYDRAKHYTGAAHKRYRALHRVGVGCSKRGAYLLKK